MKVFYTAEQQFHHPLIEVFEGGKVVTPFEIPERCDIVLSSLKADSRFSVARPSDHGLGPLEAVHTREYLAFLKSAWDEWARSGGGQGREHADEVSPVLLASTFVPRRAPTQAAPPASASISAKIGFYAMDLGCPLVAGTYNAAYWAAQSAVEAALTVRNGPDRSSFALCRPPGHHAGKDFMGGYCFINNAAIAAQVLTEGGKTCAVVDVDYHAGNGTQDIFFDRGDVFVCSLHADPYQEYPYHVGHASETGVGAGEGCHLNVPLPVTTGDQEYLAALEGALKRVRQFNPDYVVVSFGADTAEVDPLGTMNVTQEGFGKIGAAIRALDKPTVVVFEGGYGVKELGGNTLAFLAPFL